jgi:uncharacterized protein YbjT (DUF2867 family)
MITVAGASGKTGSKAAEALLWNGEKVRVIGRSADHLTSLQEKGAVPFVGDMSEVNFLTSALAGADAAYLLVPPKMDTADIRKYYTTMTRVMVEAIKRSGIKKVVFLSSLGAERASGTGPVTGLHDAEKLLGALSSVDIVFLRAGYFYENTLMNVGLIHSRQIVSSSITMDAPIFMVAANDIGQKAAELLAKRDFAGHTVVDLFGQLISYYEIALLIGKRLDMPQLRYVQASDKESMESMTSMGISKNMAKSFIELARSVSAGKIISTTLNPKKPNAPTPYSKFVDEVFYPLYKKAA